MFRQEEKRGQKAPLLDESEATGGDIGPQKSRWGITGRNKVSYKRHYTSLKRKLKVVVQE